MHNRIPYTDPLLELLDCIEDAVQLVAFDYFSAAGDEVNRALRLLDGTLKEWQDEDAALARQWLRQAAQGRGKARERRGVCAGALWRARRAVKRRWLAGLGVAWDPYDAALLPPGPRAVLRLVGSADGDSQKPA